MNLLIKREKRACDGELLWTGTCYFINPVSVKIKVTPKNRKQLIIYTAFDYSTFKYEEIVDLEVKVDKTDTVELNMSREIMEHWGGKP